MKREGIELVLEVASFFLSLALIADLLTGGAVSQRIQEAFRGPLDPVTENTEPVYGIAAEAEKVLKNEKHAN